MDPRTLSALYGLKWNPFLNDIPIEALCKTPRIDHFAWRVEDLVMHGGFALVTGDPGAGKSTVLRLLAERLAGLRDVVVGELTRPQSRVTDFYRELGDLFGLAVSTSNRWGAYKTVRAKWQAHIQQTLFRPVLLVDEAQEMPPLLLAELRLLGSTKLDTCTIVTVVLCGDRRLEEKLRTQELLPVDSRIRTRLVLDAGGGTDAVEAATDDPERVLGGEEQDAAGAQGGEAAQARRARRDGDGHVEREKRLAALRLAPDDADGFVAPQVLDEPAPLGWARIEVRGARDRQRCRRCHRRVDDGVLRAGVGVARAGRCSAPAISR